MKRGHLTMVFSIILVALFLTALIGKSSYKQAVNEKKKIDYALQMAVDSAAEQLAKAYQNTNVSDYLVAASDTFFKSLSAGLNIYEDEDKKDELTFFVPAILVTGTEGFYINYLVEVKDSNSLELRRVWTECQPYVYSDDYFIYRFFFNDKIIIYEKSSGDRIESTKDEIMNDMKIMADLSVGKVFLSEENYQEYKRAAIAKSIADTLDKTVNEHSRIAGQMGISMIYGIPEFLSDFSPAQEYPSLIAIFQGYPLTSDNKTIYNGASTSASYISVVERYVVEVSNSISQPFSIVHKNGCSKIGAYGIVLSEKYTMKEAIAAYGTYGCPHCFSERDGVAILP